MSPALLRLVPRIRERFPHLDIRTDQCALVRIIGKDLLVGIRYEGSQFRADFISLAGECDFQTSVIKTLSSHDLEVFERELLNSLAETQPS